MGCVVVAWSLFECVKCNRGVGGEALGFEVGVPGVVYCGDVCFVGLGEFSVLGCGR